MGTGIGGVVPVVCKVDNWDKKYFSEDYFDSFYFSEEDGLYQLKPELIFDNFKSFLEGFNAIIGSSRDSWVYSKWNALDKFAQEKDFEGYLDFLDEESNKSAPFYDGNSMASASVLGMKVMAGIVFYTGSYKAFLETYSTLSHMEKLLVKAFDNPLSRVAKFCIYG
ncbi:hypothetical protein FACS1894187_10730 [Synergistales bacterium]|nr:hypothetical protein FACS1894187_10730 [Synergistales bacterium]